MNKKQIKKLLTKIAEKKNKQFSDIYDYEVIEHEGNIVLIDHTEESYYERWMLKDFVNALEEKGCYLECECPGRYVVIEQEKLWKLENLNLTQKITVSYHC